ncbi:hypothetical protein NVP1251O_43 [Vibrio phage 1.251.O._10N.261.55.E5]|nr:hypothetical protein NVP1251O_43 [Vibrio phage 1.251.O._10N.261.55.E5]
MDLSKLSTALQSVNLADTADVTISPTFTLKVCQMVNYNQVYNEKLTTFTQKFPDHKFVKDFKAFMNEWYTGKQTPDTISFMAHVILCGWTLTDDDGETVRFAPGNAIKLLQTQIGRTIFSKLAIAVQQDTVFQTEWSEDAIKNS